MASDPVPPLVGTPTLGPGWLEITAPALAPLPPLDGGAKLEPASDGAPSPAPLRPRPEADGPEPPAIEGGGGTILLASSVPRGTPATPLVVPAPASDGGGGTTLGTPIVGAEDDWADRVPVPPDTPAEGGGATTFVPSEVPTALCAPRGLPLGAFAPTVGGGGTTFAVRDVRAPLFVPFG